MPRLAFISPHFDDVVFSCAQRLQAHPRSIVVTVFAGMPSAETPPTSWDARCGFTDPVEAVTARREEDRRALHLLDARPVWLDFLDDQYGVSASPESICLALQHALRDLEVDELIVPMGLFHTDHVLAHDAALLAWRSFGRRLALSLYEDVPYRSLPGLLQQRLNVLTNLGMMVTPCAPAQTAAPQTALRTAAVCAYASQIRGMDVLQEAALSAPERLWRLHLTDAR